MEPMAPDFLVQRLAKNYVEAADQLPAHLDDAADRARRLLLAGSRLWLLEHASTDDGTVDPAPSASRRAGRSQLYSTLSSCIDALVTSAELATMCYHSCADPDDHASIDAAAMQCMRHATARQQTAGTMTQLHSQMWEGHRIRTAFQDEYCRTSALVMTKQWNLSAHEWCTATAREFFLMDQSVRERWLARDPATRSLITVLAPEMKRRMQAARTRANAPGKPGHHTIAHDVAALLLPKLGSRLRLLDIGSCKNFFGERYPELFETTALDQCPADSSVFECDFLNLEIVTRASKGDDAHPQFASEEGSGAGQLEWLAQHSFDVAVISQVLSFIPDADARALVVEKTRQLLRSDESGILLVVEPVRVIRHAGAQLIAAIEARHFRYIPGFRYERRGDAGVGLAFATMPIDADTDARTRARELKPLHLPAHPGYMLHANSRTSKYGPAAADAGE